MTTRQQIALIVVAAGLSLAWSCGGLDPADGEGGGGEDSAPPNDTGLASEGVFDLFHDASPEASEDVPALPAPCAVPQAPVLPIVHQDAVLQFALPGGSTQVVHHLSQGSETSEPDKWTAGHEVKLHAEGLWTVFARPDNDACGSETVFRATYEVRESYPDAPGTDDSTAVAMDDPAGQAWATGFVAPAQYGEDLDEEWKTPEKGLGPATGSASDIVVLGRGGSLTLSFDSGVSNAEGYDFAVFENGFGDTFLELAFVEVSSDGETFERFDSAYLGTEKLGPFGEQPPTAIGSLAGTYRLGYGTPFDLEALANKPAIRDGTVDLDAIRFVRIVDIIGDGTATDSFGNPIYDPYPTTGSAGFDLEAVGVLHLGNHREPPQ